MIIKEFTETEKEYFNKKPAAGLSKIIFGCGYIIRNGQLTGYETKEVTDKKSKINKKISPLS